MTEDNQRDRISAGHAARWVILGVGVVWLIGHLCWQVVMSVRLFLTGEPPTVAVYGLFYSLFLGGVVLVFRERIAAPLRRSPVPKVVWFLLIGLLFCTFEEFMCYWTNSGMWTSQSQFYPQIVVGIGVLEAWVAGVYIVGRFLRLKTLELFIVTGICGWFMEVMIARPGGLIAAPLLALAWLPFTVWGYSVLVLIPVALVPGPEAVRSTGGRWWRYPVAFLIPLAILIAVAWLLSLALPKWQA